MDEQNLALPPDPLSRIRDGFLGLHDLFSKPNEILTDQVFQKFRTRFNETFKSLGIELCSIAMATFDEDMARLCTEEIEGTAVAVEQVDLGRLREYSKEGDLSKRFTNYVSPPVWITKNLDSIDRTMLSEAGESDLAGFANRVLGCYFTNPDDNDHVWFFPFHLPGESQPKYLYQAAFALRLTGVDVAVAKQVVTIMGGRFLHLLYVMVKTGSLRASVDRLEATNIVRRAFSHDIGSHAYKWVCNDLRLDHGQFFENCNLQLMAGHYVSEQPAGCPYNLRKLIEELRDQKILLHNIVRSLVPPNGYDLYGTTDLNSFCIVNNISDIHSASLNYGVFGAQAVFSIIVNIIINHFKHFGDRSESPSHTKFSLNACETNDCLELSVSYPCSGADSESTKIRQRMDEAWRKRRSGTAGGSCQVFVWAGFLNKQTVSETFAMSFEDISKLYKVESEEGGEAIMFKLRLPKDNPVATIEGDLSQLPDQTLNLISASSAIVVSGPTINAVKRPVYPFFCLHANENQVCETIADYCKLYKVEGALKSLEAPFEHNLFNSSSGSAVLTLTNTNAHAKLPDEPLTSLGRKIQFCREADGELVLYHGEARKVPEDATFFCPIASDDPLYVYLCSLTCWEPYLDYLVNGLNFSIAIVEDRLYNTGNKSARQHKPLKLADRYEESVTLEQAFRGMGISFFKEEEASISTLKSGDFDFVLIHQTFLQKLSNGETEWEKPIETMESTFGKNWRSRVIIHTGKYVHSFAGHAKARFLSYDQLHHSLHQGKMALVNTILGARAKC